MCPTGCVSLPFGAGKAALMTHIPAWSHRRAQLAARLPRLPRFAVARSARVSGSGSTACVSARNRGRSPTASGCSPCGRVSCSRASPRVALTLPPPGSHPVFMRRAAGVLAWARAGGNHLADSSADLGSRARVRVRVRARALFPRSRSASMRRPPPPRRGQRRGGRACMGGGAHSPAPRPPLSAAPRSPVAVNPDGVRGWRVSPIFDTRRRGHDHRLAHIVALIIST